ILAGSLAVKFILAGTVHYTAGQFIILAGTVHYTRRYSSLYRRTQSSTFIILGIYQYSFLFQLLKLLPRQVSEIHYPAGTVHYTRRYSSLYSQVQFIILAGTVHYTRRYSSLYSGRYSSLYSQVQFCSLYSQVQFIILAGTVHYTRRYSSLYRRYSSLYSQVQFIILAGTVHYTRRYSSLYSQVQFIILAGTVQYPGRYSSLYSQVQFIILAGTVHYTRRYSSLYSQVQFIILAGTVHYTRRYSSLSRRYSSLYSQVQLLYRRYSSLYSQVQFTIPQVHNHYLQVVQCTRRTFTYSYSSWGQIRPEFLLNPKKHSEETHPSQLTPNVYHLIWGIMLAPKAPELINTKLLYANLTELETIANGIAMKNSVFCELCKTHVDDHQTLRVHLSTRRHDQHVKWLNSIQPPPHTPSPYPVGLPHPSYSYYDPQGKPGPPGCGPPGQTRSLGPPSRPMSRNGPPRQARHSSGPPGQMTRGPPSRPQSRQVPAGSRTQSRGVQPSPHGPPAGFFEPVQPHGHPNRTNITFSPLPQPRPKY
ncbi:hypothetical protein WDU94_013848, partial [Cyamophila willieti]